MRSIYMAGLTEIEVIKLKRLVPVLAEQLVFIDGRPLVLERPWQYNLVGSTNLWEIWTKARQIGFSWGDALCALIRAQLFPQGTYNKVFVSINREEAKEKIRYVQNFYECMPTQARKKVLTDNKLELVFSNGNTVRSLPSRPVRGVPNVDLSLDEFAHVKEARRIYEGSTASTIRGMYGVRIGSTPFGRGLFGDICNGAGNDGEFRHFKKYEVRWWESRVLCKDVSGAALEAQALTTEDRVKKFGTPRLNQEYESLPLEAFQQEFESAFIDTGNSVLTEELIMSRSDGSMSCPIIDIDCDNSAIQVDFQVEQTLYEVKQEGNIAECFIGVDVGREINATEIIVLSHVGEKLKTVMYITLRHAPYPIQEAVIQLLMKELPVKKLVIDSQGIGNQLGQAMQTRYGSKAHPMIFSMLTKEEMVSATLKAFEKAWITFYPTRRMLSQLLSVKKAFSESGRILYKAAQTKEEQGYKSHADLFWALAMAIWGASEFCRGHVPTTGRSPILHLGNYSGWSGLNKPSRGGGGFGRKRR
jgi:phage FluMu gp28-like protein